MACRLLRNIIVIFAFWPTVEVSAASPRAAVKFSAASDSAPNRYIVVLKQTATGPNSAVIRIARTLINRHGGVVLRSYEGPLTGFAIDANEAQARRLSQLDEVAYVVADGQASAETIQANSPWGLDRVDQRALPLSGTYQYTNNGKGVNVYVIDSGIYAEHPQFGGRVRLDFDAVGDDYGAQDCFGHGTYVAGIIGSANLGVAKGVTLHSVRVLNCDGDALWSDIIAGIDWVTRNAKRPAVVNMSLGGELNAAVDDAVRRAAAANITFVVSAGNSGDNACLYSPSRTFSAVTVAASMPNDSRAEFSNYGSCVDIFAPGTDIPSLSAYDPNTIVTTSGTSAAAPHVAGIAALYLERFPQASRKSVTNAIVGTASVGRITDAGRNSPNQLLNTQRLGGTRTALFRYSNSQSGGHFYSRDWNELGGGRNNFRYDGVTGYVSVKALPNTIPLYRYFNANTGQYRATIHSGNPGAIGTWTYQGIMGYVPTTVSPETTEVHRYRNSSNGELFLTSNWNELRAGAGAWVYEGVECLIWKRL